MFVDYGQRSQAAQPSFVEIPNLRVTTTMGRMEVTDIRPETVTGRLLDDQNNLLQEDRNPVYICVRKAEILCATERANMMSWWQLGEQAVWNHDCGWKNTLNNLRLIIQLLLLFWLISPWVDLFPIHIYCWDSII